MKKWIPITNETLPWGVAHPLQTDKGLAYFFDHDKSWRKVNEGEIHPTKYMEGSPEMFTLDDMLEAWASGWISGYIQDEVKSKDMKNDYFKNKFNIEL